MEKVIVEGAPVEDKTADTPVKTTIADKGVESAKKKTPAGPSKGLDTEDHTAKAWVGSGAKADASIKGFDAPSGDELREQSSNGGESGLSDLARDDIENLVAGNSNHNTVAAVNPVLTAQLDKPDYNPQRRPSSKANMQSTVGEAPQLMAARVDAKKEGPTNSEIVTDRLNRENENRDKPLEGYESGYAAEQ